MANINFNNLSKEQKDPKKIFKDDPDRAKEKNQEPPSRPTSPVTTYHDNGTATTRF